MHWRIKLFFFLVAAVQAIARGWFWLMAGILQIDYTNEEWTWGDRNDEK